MGKSFMSMGHLYHGYVSHNQRVKVMKVMNHQLKLLDSNIKINYQL